MMNMRALIKEYKRNNETDNDDNMSTTTNTVSFMRKSS